MRFVSAGSDPESFDNPAPEADVERGRKLNAGGRQTRATAHSAASDGGAVRYSGERRRREQMPHQLCVRDSRPRAQLGSTTTWVVAICHESKTLREIRSLGDHGQATWLPVL